jgi:capsular polysaccharide biosynthesis protein
MYSLSEFIESRRPHCKQIDADCDLDYNIKYFYPNEPDIHFNKIPKTPSIEIHKSITDYLCHVKKYNFNPFYVAEGKSIQVRCMNDVGSVIVADEKGNVFEDISSRYKFEVDDDVNEIHLSGENVLLALDSGSNYFHWLCQILPRIKLLQDNGIDWSKINKILIPEVRGDFVKHSLKSLNVPIEKIIETKKNDLYSFESLIIPCKPNNHIYVSRWSIEFLKSTFLKKNSEQKDKIYIKRKEAQGRNIINEKEILPILKEKGYRAIYLEDYNIFEQARIFNTAKSIVSPHGAALGNLVFCQQGTHFLELFNASHFHCLYWNFANILDLDYYYYQSNNNMIAPPNNKNQNIHIETSIFRDILI